MAEYLMPNYLSFFIKPLVNIVPFVVNVLTREGETFDR